jgi:hypothetical protein
LEQTHGPGKNPFQQPDLTEGEMEFGGDEGQKEVDGIGKPVIDKVVGAKGKERAEAVLVFLAIQWFGLVLGV